jgi:hypothetical protein
MMNETIKQRDKRTINARYNCLLAKIMMWPASGVRSECD